jgi:hypothetical protein
MPTVLRLNGFRVVIRTDDHGSPHVHVLYGGEWVAIYILTLGIKEVLGMKTPDVKAAVRLVEENRDYLLAEWRRIHG